MVRSSLEIPRDEQDAPDGSKMGSTGRKSEPPKQADDEAKKKPPPSRADDDEDFEDGDIATPKRDRHGNDDEPL